MELYFSFKHFCCGKYARNIIENLKINICFSFIAIKPLIKMISSKQLSGGEHTILKGRYRVRLFDSNAVPFVHCHQHEMGDRVIVVDLPEAEGWEAKMIEAQKHYQTILSSKATGAFGGEDKENLPVDCELEGDPLKVTFLSIEKLDKMAASNRARFEEDRCAITSLDRFANFDLHLIPQMEAHGLINDLSLGMGNFFADDLSQHSVLLFSDGSKLQQIFLLGIRRTNKQISTFRARYLGDFDTAVYELDTLGSDLNKFPLRKVQCWCRFDVLDDTILVDKTGNFVPATFSIEAEWNPDKRFVGNEAKTNIYLQMPPDNATVTVKFKPGWMDSRISLTDRINELRYLAQLAAHLKAGTVPWSVKNEDNAAQDALMSQAALLIKSAKDKLDARAVFPFDFTDRLWDVLKTAKSVDLLRRVFQQIYEQLQTGEFRVLVEANKTSSLAKMLRMRNPDEIIFPRLEPMTCLQLLVEIGIDRFNGELSHRFLADQFLPNTLDLDPFFLHFSSPVENRIERLIPLHLALQSMTMIEAYVQLPQHEKTNMAKRLLAHFTAMKGTDAFEKEFVYKANMEDLRSEKLKNTLSVWILERHYDKYTRAGMLSRGNSSISDMVHISKHIGIKYIQPAGGQSNEMPALDMTSVKRELPTSPPVSEKEEEAAPKEQFECAYLLVNNQPSALFL